MPLPDAVAVELAEHLRRYPASGEDLVFTSREHKPLNRNYFNHGVWHRALTDAGVEQGRDNGMHALRHFYASVLIDAGGSVKAVAEHLGHADPGFTLRVYAHLFPSSDERAINQPVLPKRAAIWAVSSSRGRGSSTSSTSRCGKRRASRSDAGSAASACES